MYFFLIGRNPLVEVPWRQDSSLVARFKITKCRYVGHIQGYLTKAYIISTPYTLHDQHFRYNWIAIFYHTIFYQYIYWLYSCKIKRPGLFCPNYQNIKKYQLFRILRYHFYVTSTVLWGQIWNPPKLPWADQYFRGLTFQSKDFR